jgi:hypothetical protein
MSFYTNPVGQRSEDLRPIVLRGLLRLFRLPQELGKFADDVLVQAALTNDYCRVSKSCQVSIARGFGVLAPTEFPAG